MRSRIYIAPTIGEVTLITKIANPVLRNLQITQAYQQISCAMAQYTGPGANWCTFATWASKQAGQTIRREDLVRTFERLFRTKPEIGNLIQRLTVHLAAIGQADDLPILRKKLLRALNPALAFERASDAVARGNLKVFAELGPVFVCFLEEFVGSSEGDSGRLAEFCAALRQGESPEGQVLLRQAFTAYHEIKTEPATRTERMFYANLLIGFHEQTRLQPEISEAMNAMIGDRKAIKEELLRAIYPALALKLRRRISLWLGRHPPLDTVLDQLIDEAQQCVREVITRHLMTLRLAHGEMLLLGDDLPVRAFPPALKEITYKELAGLLARIDPTPDSLSGSGARDWADFDDRMHFITDYFRCYHDQKILFESPFSSAQLEDLRAGKMPPPPL